MIRLSVRVIGPPLAIWLLKSGITEPLEPRTLPNLTAAKLVLLSVLHWIIISPIRLDAPMIFVGFTALSVEIIMNFSTP